MSYRQRTVHEHTCDFCGVGASGATFPEGWTRMWAPTAADMVRRQGHTPEELDACLVCSERLLRALDAIAEKPTQAYVEALEHVRFVNGLEEVSA